MGEAKILLRDSSAATADVPVEVERKLTVPELLWNDGFVRKAAIILFLGAGSYYLFFTGPQQQIAVKNQKHDVAPPSSANAILTLSNGQKIILDSAGNGIVARQGNTNVMKITAPGDPRGQDGVR